MADEKQSKTRHRSPAYPLLTLAESIQKADALRKASGGFVKISTPVAMKALGYSEASSGGFRVLATLLSFGLLQDEGSGSKRQIWLSELAKKILLDTRDVSPDREAAMKEAALKPELHKWLREKYSDGLPADNEVLATTLNIEKNFNPNSTAEFINEVRATFALAKVYDSDIMSHGGADMGKLPRDNNNRSRNMNTQTGVREFTLPLLSVDGDLILSIPRSLSKRKAEKITRWWSELVSDLVKSDPEDESDRDEENAK